MGLNALLTASALLGAGSPDPVWLIVEEPAAAEAAASAGWSFITIALVAVSLCLLFVSVWLTTRRRLGRELIPPEEIAFQVLSRRMLIGRRGRRLIRRLASALGDAPPAALLISERAYRTALNRAPLAGVLVDAADAARLERRVFSIRR